VTTGFAKVYVTGAKKDLLGYVDITDALRVTATKSNVTVEGFVKEAAGAGPESPVESVAKAMREYRTDSAAIVDCNRHILGGVLSPTSSRSLYRETSLPAVWRPG